MVIQVEVNWTALPALRVPSHLWIEAWAFYMGVPIVSASDIDHAENLDEEILFALGDLPYDALASYPIMARCLSSQVWTPAGVEYLVWTDWAYTAVSANQSAVIDLPGWQGSGAA